jgi:uncharacterized protein (DUF2147 family)
LKYQKCIVLLFLLAGVSSLNAAVSQPWEVPYSIEGVWKIVDDSSGSDIGKARLWIQHDTLYGVIQEIFGNSVAPVCGLCSGALKDKPIVGMRFMWGFVERNGYWSKGRIVDFQNGKIYKCDIELPDETSLNVFSYIHFIIKIGRTQKWVKYGE